MAVEVAPDLKTCRAYISVLGEKEAKEATIKGLMCIRDSLVCNHTGMEPDLQRQIQSLQSILINEEIQDKEIASVSYEYFYCKDT